MDTSAVLETAAPDIYNEEALFAPRSKAQEDANVGTVEERARAGKPCLPAGAWVEAVKELVPPPPPPEVRKILLLRVCMYTVAQDISYISWETSEVARNREEPTAKALAQG